MIKARGAPPDDIGVDIDAKVARLETKAYNKPPDRFFNSSGHPSAWRPSRHGFKRFDGGPSQPPVLYAFEVHEERRGSSECGGDLSLDGDSNSRASADESMFGPKPGNQARPVLPKQKVADDEMLIIFESELPIYLDLAEETQLAPHTFDGQAVEGHGGASNSEDGPSWSDDWPGYAPLDYTSPYVLFHGPGCPEVDNFNLFPWAHPADVAEARGAGLLANSWHGEYLYDTQGLPNPDRGIPRHPIGRTGLTGRGLLGKWGPNHARDHVITRWKRGGNDTRIERKSRPLLEVLVIKKYTADCWALPGAILRGSAAPGDPQTDVNPLIRKVFGIDNAQYLETNDMLKEVEAALLQNSNVIYQGCTMDSRDTDNAWMESEVFHFHDEFNILADLQLKGAGEDGVEAVTWAVAHAQLELMANHLSLLRLVCKSNRAYW